MKKVAVIGAGAAGCFCAIELKRSCPSMEVHVWEELKHPLSKVAVTGGGRCNISNTFEGITSLEEAYPRGARIVKRAFSVFGPEDTSAWWENEGVPLVAQEDFCIFPESQDAMQVVRTLENLMDRTGVELRCGRRVSGVRKDEGIFRLCFADGAEEGPYDAVVLAAGGKSRKALEGMLPGEVAVTRTVPSLFTLKIQDPALRSLMGTVVENAALCIAGTSFRAEGALLITDWGISGPATLRLSSYAARYLADNNYSCPLVIGWLGRSEEVARNWIEKTVSSSGARVMANAWPQELTSRLWKYILFRCKFREGLRWAELGSRGRDRLVSELCSAEYRVEGRAAFKEEFVTCGGVDLSGVNPTTLESRQVPGLYFAGEVLDMDAITGGFNLQAAWSTGMAVARAVAGNLG